MENINTQLKEKAAPGVLSVIDWALLVHEDTMRLVNGNVEDQTKDQLLQRRYTLDEREEARQILLDYGAGKPARIMIHKGSKKEPIQFATVIAPTNKQLKEPDTIEAEFSE